MNHGAYGELGPIVAMAVLLGARGPLESLVVLVGFAVLAVLVHRFATAVQPRGLEHPARSYDAVRRPPGRPRCGSWCCSWSPCWPRPRSFELDAVLGAFAAGFVLRQLVPEGHESLEHKLEGLAFGLLIPIFFITSGMAIDPMAVVEEPVALVAFVVLILVVRGGVVFVASTPPRASSTGGRAPRSRRSPSTGLPIIVAVTTVAERPGR